MENTPTKWEILNKHSSFVTRIDFSRDGKHLHVNIIEFMS